MDIYSKKLLQVGVKKGTVVFESSTAGTYTINIPYTQKYNIILVGAGGGGTCGFSWYSNGQFRWRFAQGGAGGLVQGTVKLKKGTYTGVVGKGASQVYSGGGIYDGGSGAHAISTAGGNTSLDEVSPSGYVDVPFVQPVYDGTNISTTLFDTSKFAVNWSSAWDSSYYGTNLFNTLYASGGHDTGGGKIWESNGGSSNLNPWIKFSNPVPLKLSSIEFDFRIEQAYRVPKSVIIYGLNKDNTTVQLTTHTFTQERTLQNVNVGSQQEFYGFYLYFAGSGGTGAYNVTEIANLNIAATYKIPALKVIAKGGGKSRSDNDSSLCYGGTGGSYTIPSSYTGLLGTNGVSGTWQGHQWNEAQRSGQPSDLPATAATYGSYGYGGASYGGTDTPYPTAYGGPGYIKITAL